MRVVASRGGQPDDLAANGGGSDRNFVARWSDGTEDRASPTGNSGNVGLCVSQAGAATQGVARVGSVPVDLIYPHVVFGERHDGNARNQQELDEQSARNEATRVLP